MDATWSTRYILRVRPRMHAIDPVVDAIGHPVEAILVVVSKRAAGGRRHIVDDLVRCHEASAIHV